MRYWERKGRIAPGKDAKVEWTQHYRALQSLPRAKRQWVQKHYCGFTGTNYVMHKQGEQTTSTCPSCAETETHQHITQCQSNRATAAYRNIGRKFETWLKQTTSDQIRHAILQHCDAYRDQGNVETPVRKLFKKCLGSHNVENYTLFLHFWTNL